MSIFKDLIGGGIKGIADSAVSIIKQFKLSPEQAVEAEQKIKELENKAEEIKNTLIISLEQEASKQLETVNATMRAEAQSERWAQWAWRPFIGFTFCAILVNNYILLPYFKNKGMEIIIIPDNVWTAILVILGAASAGRGWEKVEKAKK
jgi:hypothetical protein